MNKLRKLFEILTSFNIIWLKALRLGVAPSLEHKPIINNLLPDTVVDIGANRGQFTLLVSGLLDATKIYAFEPLAGPSARFLKLFAGNDNVVLVNSAIGPERIGSFEMNVSNHDDSSSILPITELQVETYPGTQKVSSEKIQIAPLDQHITIGELKGNTLLKIDVQGYELKVLQGCESLLSKFDWIYCECSFLELYKNQALAHEVITWLNKRGFNLTGVYNVSYSANGMAIQGDLFFCKEERKI